MNQAPVRIISASAGSGKTYQLVLQYLTILLTSSDPFIFKKMLAITFTNKAVNEMKTRVLEKLSEVSNYSDSQDDTFFEDLKRETSLETEVLKKKAKSTLNFILNDYSNFSIITIDSLNHKIIRSFARDLGLSYSFEIEINSAQFLENVVDNLIEKVGKDKNISTLLKDFVVQKTEESKNWNVREDVLKFIKIVHNENDRKAIDKLKKISAAEFKTKKNKLFELKKENEQKIIELAKVIMALFKSNGLSKKDFYYGTIYNYFDKISNGDISKVLNPSLEKNLAEGTNVYNKSTPESAKSKIDALLNKLIDTYDELKQLSIEHTLTSKILNQYTPFQLLNQLNKEIEQQQHSKNKVLLSTFNDRISKEIKKYDAPFIYERMSEQYQHYFLDEFQDTSVLQWNNLIPLITYSVDEKGSLFLVGDPKQAIYRWRGGKVEQMISLMKQNTFGNADAQVTQLEKNYRSADPIVHFNNTFYKFICSLMKYEVNKELYNDLSQQELNGNEYGHVELNFCDKDEEINILEILTENIHHARKNGYDYKDIAVLVRKNKEEIKITEHLNANQIPCISSDALLLDKSEKVKIVIALLYLAVDENLKDKKHQLLQGLYKIKNIKAPYTDFLINKLKLSTDEILKSYFPYFSFKVFKQKPLYEAIEFIYENLHFYDTFDAYTQELLDLIFNFSKQQNTFFDFLLYWENEGHNSTITSPEKLNGVRIMTIHKSKGLEFPVVILPYLNNEIISYKLSMFWLNTRGTLASVFPFAWTPLSQQIASFGKEGKELYELAEKESELDNLNVLYVATTRAINHLYMISPEIDKSKYTEPFLLKDYVEQSNVFTSNGNKWTFGTIHPEKKRKKEKTQTKELVPQHSTEWHKKINFQNREVTKATESIKYGRLVHEILSQIEYNLDWKNLKSQIPHNYPISEKELKEIERKIESVLFHPKLNSYFQEEFTVYNERDFLLPNGEQYRPDRLIINSEHVVIIDYKTGKQHSSHKEQLDNYATIASEIFSKKAKKILVYIKNEIEVLEL